MEWVKAHQEKSTPVELLPLAAQLNVKADADVTEFCMNTPPCLMPTASPLQFRYLKIHPEKTGLTTAQMDEIEWDQLGDALELQKLHTM
eukprot:3534611-Ditylum_brightwellii.AAC.1